MLKFGKTLILASTCALALGSASLPTANGGDQFFQAPPKDGPAPEEGIWIDAESIRDMVGSKNRPELLKLLEPMLDRAIGIHTAPDDATSGMSVTFYFSESFTALIADPHTVKNGQIYAVKFPKVTRFTLTLDEPEIHISAPRGRSNIGAIKMKLPMMPDTIYLRRISVNLEGGLARLQAGAFGNSITIFARSQLFENFGFKDIEAWRSIGRTFAAPFVK